MNERLGLTFLLLATACSASASPSSAGTTTDTTAPPFTGSSTTPGPSAAGSAPAAPPPAAAPPADPPDAQAPPLDPTVDPATLSNPEELYVLMKGHDGSTWFCTGTLIAKDVVVTAGHCLDPSLLVSWEVASPTIASHPRVKASRVAIYDTSWDDPAHPDLGIIKLAAPIALGQYAVLTDVSALVDAGQPTSVGAIIRTLSQPEAPFHAVGPLPLSNASDQGYLHSYAVPMFSKGGDSGAGLFVVENGALTHKLAAVEHTPDPARGLDHVTRVEAAFITWVAANSVAP